jgi:hypothetical protein
VQLCQHVNVGWSHNIHGWRCSFFGRHDTRATVHGLFWSEHGHARVVCTYMCEIDECMSAALHAKVIIAQTRTKRRTITRHRCIIIQKAHCRVRNAYAIVKLSRVWVRTSTQPVRKMHFVCTRFNVPNSYAELEILCMMCRIVRYKTELSAI